jgi:membrane fusion protein, multidrug efflux system
VSAPAAAGGRGGRGGGRAGGGPVPVVTAEAQKKAVPVTIPAVGTVESVASVQIRSQVTGQLTAVHFTEGQEVAQGQPLFSLDARAFKAAMAQAQAAFDRDSATLRNAREQQARNETLFQRGLLSRDLFETQRASTAALAATVDADRAAMETARLNLVYAEIAAPISGRTGSLGAHVGDMVRANDSASLVVISQLAPIYVTFSVPGRFLAEIRRYQAQAPLTVVAAVPSESNADVTASGASATGRVTFIDNSVDSTTGTIKLKGTFQNADHLLWPGTFVRVVLNLTVEPDCIVVPATAVQASQDGQFIYVVKNDQTVDFRKVTVRRQQGDEVVVADGIAAGDVVVTDGQLRLAPGARVMKPGEAGGARAAGGRRGAGSEPGGTGAAPAGRSR